MTTDFDARALTVDLLSDNPERVERAIDVLNDAAARREPFPMEFPYSSVLDAFGETAPPEVIGKYVSILQDFDGFTPWPSFEDLWREQVNAVFAHGRGERVFDLVTQLWLTTTPDGAVEQVLRFFRGVDWDDPKWNDPERIGAVQALVHHPGG